jgi:hypothetical protein
MRTRVIPAAFILAILVGFCLGFLVGGKTAASLNLDAARHAQVTCPGGQPAHMAELAPCPSQPPLISTRQP